VTVEPDMGDAWAWFYKFELEQNKVGHASLLLHSYCRTPSHACASLWAITHIRAHTG
jgi:hypothetical protein